MAKSLKDQNRWPLLLVILVNVAIFYVAVKTGAIAVAGIDQLIKGWKELLPSGAVFVLTSVLNELLTTNTKARIVFLRWNDPLPGSRAFTVYAKRDPRVDIASLTRQFGTLPTAPREQNALWYKMYKSIGADPAVEEIHRNFLFTRDYAVASLLLLLVLGTLGFWMISSLTTAGVYCLILLLQYILAGQAARNHGIRFVTTVLAIKSAT